MASHKSAPRTEGEKYRAFIESLVPSGPAPLSKEEKAEVRRLVRENEWDQAEAEERVLRDRPSEDEEEGEEEHLLQAIERHRSYLPLVEMGLMTAYEAVREVGANRSANGRGQER